MANEKKLAEEKAEALAPEAAEPLPAPGEKMTLKGDAKLPVYDEEAKLMKAAEVRGSDDVVPDTPSGYALKKLGNLDGEDVDHSKAGATDAALEHGEAYQRLKSAVRWGYIVPGSED
jgi:hypothetical protein